MSLIERYVHAVTKHLAQSQRDDVAQELRTSIEDMASDKSKNGEPTERDVKAVLTELGDPAILAGNYSNTKRYLIGPAWFDTYLSVLKQILYYVPAIVTAVMFAINFAQGDMSWIQVILSSIGTGVMTGIHICFWTTLVFVILERAGTVNPKDILAATNATKGAWTPKDLPELPKKRQIPAAEAWVTAGLMAVGVAWVALSPFTHTRNGHTLFDPALAHFWLPAFCVLGALGIIHKMFQAHIGNWTKPLLATHIALGIASITFVITAVSYSPIINLDFLNAFPMNHDVSPEKLAEWARWTVSISAVAFVATYIWEIIDAIIKNRRLQK